MQQEFLHPLRLLSEHAIGEVIGKLRQLDRIETDDEPADTGIGQRQAKQLQGSRPALRVAVNCLDLFLCHGIVQTNGKEAAGLRATETKILG